jgi:hypothetical protein
VSVYKLSLFRIFINKGKATSENLLIKNNSK